MPILTDIPVFTDSKYDITRTGGRKIVRLSNGWFVAGAFDGTSSNMIAFYVSKDNGATWQSLTYTNPARSLTVFSITSFGTTVYCVASSRGSAVISFWKFDSLTATWSGLAETILDNISATTTDCDIIINETGTELHATWSGKTATYSTQFNIRYRKGLIASDGSITWLSQNQVTNSTSTNYYTQNPSIILANNIPYIFCEASSNTNKYIAIFSPSFPDRSIMVGGDSGFNSRAVLTVTNYLQTNPQAIYVPSKINGLANGRMWVTWVAPNVTNNSYLSLYVSYSDDLGLTWSTPTILFQATSSPQTNINNPTITCNKNNEIFIIFDYQNSTTYDIGMFSFINNSWSTLTVMKDYTGNNFNFPSTYYDSHFKDLSFNMTSPLFISKENALRIIINGAFPIINISITQGDIGAKSDRTNLFTYAITSDLTMGLITEKVNNEIVATKNATSGQSLTVSLTQSQWDNVKYGLYRNSLAEANTLTIEMNGENFTYTFSKLLKTEEKIITVTKAIDDIASAMIPSLKNDIANAITSIGGSASGNETIKNLINIIRNLKLINLFPWVELKNMWFNATSMPTARYSLTASKVGSVIYCIGGYGGGYKNTNEAYDSITNSWTTKAVLPANRETLSSASVDTKIYAIGGYDGSNTVNTNYCYDTLTNTWTTKASMPTARSGLQSKSVGTNVYALGGSFSSTYYDRNEMYDTIANSWTTKAPMISTKRVFASAVVGTNIYTMGGVNPSNLTFCEVYDTIANTWSSSPALTIYGYNFTASAVGTNIYVFGGDGQLARNHMFDTIGKTWTTKENLKTPRSSLTSESVEKTIFVIGGIASSVTLGTNEMFAV